MTKQGIRGFALGMILTTIVMMTVLSFSTERKAENPVSETKPRTETETEKETPITKELIKTYLDENNSVILSEEEYNDLLAENIIKTNNEENINPENSTEENKEEIEKSTAPTKDLSQKNSSEKTEVINYTLIVKSGMNSEEVTNLLYINGIIDSKEQFKKYLDDHNLNQYIQIGDFQVNNTMSYEQLGKIITK